MMNNRIVGWVFGVAVAGLFCLDASAVVAEFDLFGVSVIEFFDDDSGDFVGEVVLGIDLSFELDPLATETSLNNFQAAATNPFAVIDVLDFSFEPGVDVPDLSAFPVFTSFSGTAGDGSPNDIGDAFVGFGELGVNFPTFDGSGPVALSPEPLSVVLTFQDAITDGDLSGVISLLDAAANPGDLLVLVDEASSITYQGELGDAFLDDIFFEIQGISVVIPEPASLTLLAAGVWLMAGSRLRR